MNLEKKKRKSSIIILDNKKCWPKKKQLLKNTATISLRNGNNFVNKNKKMII